MIETITLYSEATIFLDIKDNFAYSMTSLKFLIENIMLRKKMIVVFDILKFSTSMFAEKCLF